MALDTNLKYKGLTYEQAKESIQEWLQDDISSDEFMERYEDQDLRNTFVREENLQFHSEDNVNTEIYKKWENIQELNSQNISEFMWSSNMEMLDIVKEEIETANSRLNFIDIELTEDNWDGTFEITMDERQLDDGEFEEHFGSFETNDLSIDFLYELEGRLGQLMIESIEVKTGSYNYENPQSDRSPEEVGLEIQEVNQLKRDVLDGELVVDQHEAHLMGTPAFQENSNSKPFTKEAHKNAKEVIKERARSYAKDNHLKIEKTTKTLSDNKEKNKDLELQ